jgi:predicted metal-dependent phosphoesterase TrpH
MLFDMHIHSAFSPCGHMDLPHILSEASALGLDGICITDHDSMAAGKVIQEGMQADGLCVIIGMEYTSPDGDFLLFGPFEEIPARLSGYDLLKVVRKAGGAAVAAHPFREGRRIPDTLLRSDFITAIEVLNGRNLAEENRQAADCAKNQGLLKVGGSDAHIVDEMGRFVMRFEEKITNRSDFISALKNGNYAPELGPVGQKHAMITTH